MCMGKTEVNSLYFLGAQKKMANLVTKASGSLKNLWYEGEIIETCG